MVSHRVILFATLAVALSLSRFGFAAEPSEADRASARALFDEGRALMRAGEHRQACAKLEASRDLVAGTGILFHLAECYQELGQSASAWSLYREVAARTRAAGDSEREAAADARAAELEPRLSKLRIEVGEAASGLAVFRDGRKVPRGEWGSALPIDPGEHRIEATAPGHERFVTDVAIGADADEVVVRIAPSKQARVKPVAKPPAELLPPELRPSHAEDHATLQTLGWVFVTAGAGLTATGFALYGAGTSQLDEATDRCGAIDSCADPEAKALGEDGITLQRVGLPMGIAGAAGLVAGIVTLVAADRVSEDAERSKLTLSAGPGGGSLTLRF